MNDQTRSRRSVRELTTINVPLFTAAIRFVDGIIAKPEFNDP